MTVCEEKHTLIESLRSYYNGTANSLSRPFQRIKEMDNEDDCVDYVGLSSLRFDANSDFTYPDHIACFIDPVTEEEYWIAVISVLNHWTIPLYDVHMDDVSPNFIRKIYLTLYAFADVGEFTMLNERFEEHPVVAQVIEEMTKSESETVKMSMVYNKTRQEVSVEHCFKPELVRKMKLTGIHVSVKL